MSAEVFPLVVVGAGAAGLVVAIGAAKAGKKVLLIEKGNYGGDCTNYGCIPSKSLIAAAEAAHSLRRARTFGLSYEVPSVETDGALDYTRGVVSQFLAHENPKALEELGVSTLTGSAAFLDSHCLEVTLQDGTRRRVRAKTFVIATGSAPVIPPLEGLGQVPYLSNETIFHLENIPKSLAIIGAGAIGCEMAQAFQRLGCQCHVVEFFDQILGREEPEARRTLQSCLESEGVQFYLGYRGSRVEKTAQGIRLHIDPRQGEEGKHIDAEHLLLVVGRKPKLDSLHLSAAGVDYDERRGIAVDAYGRSSVPHIWAVGDASGGALFTHMAEWEARQVLTSLLLPGPLKVKLGKDKPVPHVIFTDPEVAAVGMSQAEAEERFGKNKIACYRVDLKDVDRAICTARTEGFVRIVTRKWSSKILGACIVAPRAGEMLGEISVAMEAGLPLRKLAKVIHPYPGYNLALRKAADKWLTETVIPGFLRFIPFTKKSPKSPED
jgi:pyruvate/2-oxoglutarate dehydrogenase complex dihydrolipoamide dehydrogenase (E3) component